MEDMLKFEMPKNQSSIIKVLGVGGGGSNAVNHMHSQGITGVDFIVCNTDTQALDMSPVPNKIALGNKGLGAGSVPEVAEKATIEKADEIKKMLSSNTEMLFITAGMGGGTGTGAAPVIAKLAKEIELEDEDVNKILVVAIVTLPFGFEGRKRKQQALKGIEEIRKYADAVLIIQNDKLRELDGNPKLSEAFKIADNVLLTAAKGIAEIITVKAYVNIDFKDVNTVMRDSGVAIMGNGISEGTDRAINAIETALNSPLLNDNDIRGSSNILLYISSGENEITMDEITDITEYIIEAAGDKAEIIWGAGRDESLGDKISVTVVATGFDKPKDEPGPKKIIGLYRDKGNEKVNEEIKETEIKPESETGVPHPTRPARETYAEEESEEESEEIRFISYKKENTPERITETPSIKREDSDQKKPVVRFSLDSPLTETTDYISKKEVAEPADEIEENGEIEFTVREKEIPPLEEAEEQEELLTNEERENMERKSKERIERLRQMSIKLKAPGGLSELENEPAYRRKNIELSEEKPSEETKVSKYTLSEGDDEAELRSDNSFLHDNVD
jgi:cell division protein FtsZ